MNRLLALFVSSLLLASCAGKTNTYELIPYPNELTPRSGTYAVAGAAFTCDERLDEASRAVVEEFAARLSEATQAGSAVSYVADPAAGEGFRFIVDEALDAERYQLDVAASGVTVRASSLPGFLYAVQTVKQLLPAAFFGGEADAATAWTLPCVAIDDAPRFAYRGLMLDVARHFFSKEEVEKIIDLMAFHKLNRLHWHLTDDQGWRIEIKRYPRLTEFGSIRKGTVVKKNWDQYDGVPYGGYYTQDEIREVVAYAAARGITVIPEIDLPGHSRTIGAVHPEIRCNYAPDTTATAGYDYRNAWCVAREENYALLEDILGEICTLFPSEYIHIGGDEVNMSQWQHCPDCQALMQQKGMTDPHQLEDLFLERVSDILRRHGKRPAVWNEAVRTGAFSRDSRVHAWESTKACLDATAKGYQTIVMPGEYFYFDMRQSQHETGHTWAGVFDTEKVYSFDFEKAGFSEEQMRNVIGLQGAFWSEIYIANHPEQPDYLDAMLFPRLCAVARLAWSGNKESWEAYYRELREEHYPRMTAMGIRYRLFPPRVSYAAGQLTATTDDGAEIRYVRDDRPEEEQVYTGPVKTDRPQLYRFYSVLGTGRSPYAADGSYYRMIRPAVKLTSSLPEYGKLPFSNVDTYKGYAYTTRVGRNGDWVLYTFAEPVTCREMVLRTGYSHLPKMQFLTGYAEVSYDGRTFERAGDLDVGAITLHPERPVKAVRLICTSDGNGTPMVVIMPPEIKPAL